MASARQMQATAVAGGAHASSQSAAAHGDQYTEGKPTIGGVRLTGLIGAGGMGRVYLGHHEVLDIDVAVKIILAERASSERFLVEARLAARIQHDNVMKVHHAGCEGERFFLVLEYIAGRTLKDVIAGSGPMPWRKACELVAQAARGLGAAHRAGIVHRDVKPSNLMLTEGGTVKVTDLGLARETSSVDGPTTFGSVLGTAAYMAPEQAQDPRQAGPPADVYALGVVLYELVSGRLPFQRETTAGMLLDHLNTQPPDLKALVPGLPSAFVDLVSRMLRKNRELRPADGDALAQDIERVLDRTASTAAPHAALSAWIWRPRRGRVAAAAALAVSIGVIAALFTQLAPFGADNQAAPVDAAADAWQTPRRAVFLLADGLTAADDVVVTKAMLASGLPVVDRQRIDAALREFDMNIAGRVDADTAAKIGRVVGGNVALYVGRHDGDEIEVSAFAVETTEIADIAVVPSAMISETVDAIIRKTVNLLPARGYVTKSDIGALLSLGGQHGVKVGDRVELVTDDAAERAAGQATVTAVERTTSVISTALENIPKRARKVAP